MNLLLLLLSSPKLLENFRAFLFQREFVLCVVSASLKSCSISLQSFSLLGLMSNVGYDFLGRRNLWVLYTKKLLSLSPVFLKTLMLHPEQLYIQWSWLCCSRPGWALADRICSIVLCRWSMPWVGLASASNWLSCNCSIRVSNKWIVYLLGYIEQCSGGGSDGYYNWYHFLKAN